MTHLARLAAALLSLLVAAPAVAGPSGPPPGLARKADAGALDRDGAIAALEAATSTGSERDRAWALALLGEQLRLAGRSDEARRRFTQARGSGVTEVLATAELGLALLEPVSDDVLRDLRTIATSAVPDSQNASRYAALAIAAKAAGAADAPTLARKALDAAARDPSLTSSVRASLAAVGLTTAPAAAPSAPVAAPRASLADAERAWRDGDPTTARTIAARLAEPADGREALEARALLQAIDQVAPARTVGVLLPLTGRYAAVAEPVKAAVLDGWGQAAPVDLLVFGDTLGTPEGAIAALRDLVETQHVMAVIGPLISDETLPVVAEAERLGVPLITMSQVVDDASPWPWVFQAWLTPRDQITALLDHVMGVEGRTTFAVLAPDNPYGARATEEWTQQVTARGGTITTTVTYPAGAKTLGDYVLPLKPASGPPAWEGLFVPDNATTVAAAASALTFHDLSIGAHRTGSNPAIPLLGLSGWNRAELVASGGDGVREGHFTDIYAPQPPATTGLLWYATDAWRTFHDRLQAVTSRAPTPSEALASEAAHLVAQALRAKPEDRWAMRAALLSLKPYGTLSEVRGFDPITRVAKRHVTVFEVKSSGFEPVAP
jgi:ABC-type branched-subunit amino acid transport system substrate-binding protein